MKEKNLGEIALGMADREMETNPEDVLAEIQRVEKRASARMAASDFNQPEDES